jgi:ring-1,2-phenylacetyl-CoA epoxidase subunit PaaD
MVSQEAVLDVLHRINDPEMPINIVDLGIVEAVRIEAGSAADRCSGAMVAIDLLPTFIGCPALQAIEEEVRRRVSALPGVAQVAVCFRCDPPWTVDRISEAGREALATFGLTVPSPTAQVTADLAPRCPFCGSSAVNLESPFGPTRCRMIYHCRSCRNSFEHLKRVGVR